MGMTPLAGRARKPIAPGRRTTRVMPSSTRLPHALPLSTDASRFGLRRLVVPTRIGDVVVHARAGTDAPPTILLHGAAGSWTTWTPLLTASALQSREAVLAGV